MIEYVLNHQLKEEKRNEKQKKIRKRKNTKKHIKTRQNAEGTHGCGRRVPREPAAAVRGGRGGGDADLIGHSAERAAQKRRALVREQVREQDQEGREQRVPVGVYSAGSFAAAEAKEARDVGAKKNFACGADRGRAHQRE